MITVLEQIRANAELTRSILRDNLEVEMNYDAASIEWLEGYIERNREAWDENMTSNLIIVPGSFLGECLCRNYDGEWVEMDGR